MHNAQLGRDLDELFKAQQERIDRNTAAAVARSRIRRTERLAETLRAGDVDLRTGTHATGPARPTLHDLDQSYF